MKMNVSLSPISRRRRRAGFSLIEVSVGMGLLATVLGALFSSFTSGFFTLRLARENLRATQILLEKVETIRLYNWDQVTTPGFIPTNFVAVYDPQTGSSGPTYNGTMTISDAPISSSYAPDMRQFKVRIDWDSGGLARNREFITYVTRNGLQSYIY